jgi:hypothetical protein
MAISQTLFTAKVAKDAKKKELFFYGSLLATGEEILPKPAKPVLWKRKVHGNNSDPSLRFGISKATLVGRRR